MFGWFRSKPTCPVDSVIQSFIEERMLWMIQEFGQDRLLQAPTILPNEQFFPDPYHAREKDVAYLFRMTCKYLDVPPKRVELGFYKEALPDEHPFSGGGHTLGLYEQQAGSSKIWIETSDLEDPNRILATLAHELCHERLLGEKRIAQDDPNHEPLTDLLTVFLGMGIFSSSHVITSKIKWLNDGAGVYQSGPAWSISRSGYLTIPMYGYALAIYSWWRREITPQWVQYLNPEVRDVYRQGWAYLCSDQNKSLQPLKSN